MLIGLRRKSSPKSYQSSVSLRGVMPVKTFSADFCVVGELLVRREIDDRWLGTRQQSDEVEEGREGRWLSSIQKNNPKGIY
ncbi:unnamed protein product [Lactuca virosa]|uniref:Uncharacterized protein n=1 Tax=Lactuca virosa TaxID=75947 RepID=A0AAU9PV29_9ASTR|nr:unnamed protein product [Lactuca virosa]